MTINTIDLKKTIIKWCDFDELTNFEFQGNIIKVAEMTDDEEKDNKTDVLLILPKATLAERASLKIAIHTNNLEKVVDYLKKCSIKFELSTVPLNDIENLLTEFQQEKLLFSLMFIIGKSMEEKKMDNNKSSVMDTKE